MVCFFRRQQKKKGLYDQMVQVHISTKIPKDCISSEDKQEKYYTKTNIAVITTKRPCSEVGLKIKIDVLHFEQKKSTLP